jgi:hypothetical protein
MIDKIRFLNTSFGKFPILFSLNVMEQLQEKYGDLTKWQEKISEQNAGITDILLFFELAINEGIDYLREINNEKIEKISKKKVGWAISEVGFQEAVKLLQETVINSTKAGEDTKNAQTTGSLN